MNLRSHPGLGVRCPKFLPLYHSEKQNMRETERGVGRKAGKG